MKVALFAALLVALSFAGASPPPSEPPLPHQGVAVWLCGEFMGVSVLIDGEWEHYGVGQIMADTEVQDRIKTVKLTNVYIRGPGCECFKTVET